MSFERPYVDFKQVKEQVSIPDALTKLGLMDQFTVRAGVVTGVCPIPTHVHGARPNKQQFRADDKKGPWLWRCFGDCDAGGDVVELVKRVAELDDAHVRFWFADNFADVLNLKKPKGESVTPDEGGEGSGKADQPKPIKPLSFYLDVDTEAGATYLAKRGISMETARRYGVGLYTKPKKMFSGYLVVPVHRYPKQSSDENPVGYVGRWPGENYDDEHPRYKVGFEASQVVFGLEQALESTDANTPLIVVEGVLKALWLIDRGYPNCVSTFTSSVSDRQVVLLTETGRPIVLAFDGNEAGYVGMRKAVAILSMNTFVQRVLLGDDKEPDQLNESELKQFYGFAKP